MFPYFAATSASFFSSFILQGHPEFDRSVLEKIVQNLRRKNYISVEQASEIRDELTDPQHVLSDYAIRRLLRAYLRREIELPTAPQPSKL
jgi:hypothetical protein